MCTRAIPRSENIAIQGQDLDFGLEGKEISGIFIDIAEKVQRRFEAEAYEVQLKTKDDKMVKSVFIRFPELIVPSLPPVTRCIINPMKFGSR